MPSKALSIVIVNYHSERHLPECLLSVRKKIGDLAEIIVVNNDERDISPFLVGFPEAKVIKKNNAGFGAGANAGFLESSADIILFLNPDARIMSQNFQAVADEFKNDPRLAIIGPALISDGKIQPWSAGRDTSLFDLARNNLRIPKSRTIWGRKFKTPADWVSGTAMFVRRKSLKELGGFDDNFFMYFEDMDLCKRARMMGMKVVYFPEFQVLHLGGESYSCSGKQKKDYYDSLEYFFKKHRSELEWRIIKLIRNIFF